jgi:hypothetical protein
MAGLNGKAEGVAGWVSLPVPNGIKLAWIPMEGKLVNKIAGTVQNAILR